MEIVVETVEINFLITYNGIGLGEVAEHETSIELQMFKLKIECQTKK